MTSYIVPELTLEEKGYLADRILSHMIAKDWERRIGELSQKLEINPAILVLAVSDLTSGVMASLLGKFSGGNTITPKQRDEISYELLKENLSKQPMVAEQLSRKIGNMQNSLKLDRKRIEDFTIRIHHDMTIEGVRRKEKKRSRKRQRK